MKTALRERLNRGETLLGGWLQLPAPLAARIVAGQGFDWVAVDGEHGPIDLETVAEMLGAICSQGPAAVVRVPAVDAVWIRRSLDAGADGIIVPMVHTAEEARRVVEYARYPPLGRRGFGFAVANEFGAQFADYARTANDRIALVVQIEHIDAVSAVDSILDVNGVDGALIGPYDLSGSMGLTGQVNHPEVLAAAGRVLAACVQRGKAAGIHVVSADPAAARPFVAQGYRFIALGLDTLFLRDAASRVLHGARTAGSPSTPEN